MRTMLYRFFLAPLTIIFVSLLFFSQTPAAYAQDSGVYTVNSVNVDAQGTSALDARKKAFAEARRLAYGRVADAVVPAAQRPNVVIPDDRVLASLVRDFEIVQEKMTTKRYAGSLNIRFNPSAFKKSIQVADTPQPQTLPIAPVAGAAIASQTVTTQNEAGDTVTSQTTTSTTVTGATVATTVPRTGTAFEDPESYIYSPAKKGVVKVAGDAGVAVAKPASKAVLVLPWFGPVGRQTLWGDNAWRNAWENDTAIARDASMPVVLAVGDTDDIRDYSPPQPLSRRGDVDALMRRYNAGHAVLAMAEQSVEGVLFVSLYQYEGSAPLPVGRFSLDATLSQNPMAEAVKKTVASLRTLPGFGDTPMQAVVPSPLVPQEAIPVSIQQQAQNLMTGTPKPYRTLAKFSGLQQWVSMRQTLARVPGISALSVRAISPSQANVEFSYAGDPGTLEGILNQSGLVLSTAASGTTGMNGAAPQYTLSYKKGY